MSATMVHKPLQGRSMRLVATVILAAMLAAFAAMFGMGGVAYANDDGNQARENLVNTVTGKLGANEYEMEGGGFANGGTLVDKQGNINAAEYDKLSSKGRDKLTSDIMKYADEKVQKDANEDKTGAGAVTEATYSNWLKDLQQNPGFGSKILNETLKQTGPDFVTGNRIFAPFAGPISTIMGLGAILIMALIGVVIVMDVAYITIPPMRLLVGDSDSGAGKAASKIITHAAISAVQDAEGGGGGDGKSKGALGQYMKKQIIMLFVLGLVLVYLIQGQIYFAIGAFLDLLNGFIGF